MWDDNITGDYGPALPDYGSASTGTGASSGGNWSAFFQQQAGNVLSTAAQVWQQTKLQNVQRGQNGYYVEGQAAPNASGGASSSSGGLLLIVGVVALLMLAKD